MERGSRQYLYWRGNANDKVGGAYNMREEEIDDDKNDKQQTPIKKSYMSYDSL